MLSLNGSFAPPGDKSISHRLALMAILASGRCVVSNCLPGEDVQSSLKALQTLGGNFETNDFINVIITGLAGKTHAQGTIDCGNSGTTMRLITGILAGRNGRFVLDGDNSLRKRPMERIAIPVRQMSGQVITTDGKCPMTIHGQALQGIDYQLPVASAQLKSAVLLAGIQASGQTRVIETTSSRDHTERLLRQMGGKITQEGNSWLVQKSDLKLPDQFYVPGDPSSAAFFLCAAAILNNSSVTAQATLLNPTRTGFLDVLKRMNIQINVHQKNALAEPVGDIQVSYSSEILATVIEENEIPSLVDEVPILTLVATQAKGTTVFKGVQELRIKETDRLAAISSQLNKMGARIEATEDTLIVHGPTLLHPVDHLESFGDHRIAMTLRLAALLTETSPDIAEETCVRISYPDFHDTLKRLLIS
ncbi:MAG: 3-phosphoshikimate 1-carboxyvinyltransferase [Candidatus Magnetomorum sp.]|nr:3-phosphoshikimate 1-carboxyvinyltransferase [Candidatus Magnetomorum sp.]